MAPKMTDAECIDKLWDGCILIDVLSLDKLRNHGLKYTKSKRDFPAGILHLNAEGNFLQIGLFDNELSKMHETKVHVFSDSVLCPAM